jgi:hypothetical protein
LAEFESPQARREALRSAAESPEEEEN